MHHGTDIAKTKTSTTTTAPWQCANSPEVVARQKRLQNNTYLLHIYMGTTAFCICFKNLSPPMHWLHPQSAVENNSDHKISISLNICTLTYYVPSFVFSFCELHVACGMLHSLAKYYRLFSVLFISRLLCEGRKPLIKLSRHDKQHGRHAVLTFFANY